MTKPPEIFMVNMWESYNKPEGLLFMNSTNDVTKSKKKKKKMSMATKRFVVLILLILLVILLACVFMLLWQNDPRH